MNNLQAIKELENLSGKSLKKYLNKDVIVDTQPLILYLLGSIDIGFVGRLGVVKDYSKEEFYFLNNIINTFSSILITPYILAEVSNRLNTSFSKKQFPEILRDLIKSFEELTEGFTSKDILIETTYFKRIGFADTSIVNMSLEKKLLVLTEDLDLKIVCEENNIDVINFTNFKFVVQTM